MLVLPPAATCCLAGLRYQGQGFCKLCLTNPGAGAQVRLMLVLAPAACCLAGLALHQLLLTLTRSLNAHARAGAAAEPPTPVKEAAPRKPSRAGKARHSVPSV